MQLSIIDSQRLEIKSRSRQKIKKISVIIGARPQFVKHSPIEPLLDKFFESFTIHTGQHYDEMMSEVFFSQFKLKNPKYMLSIGSASHGKQTAKMLEGIEDILLHESPNAVLVYGDTNSTLAGALAASKLSIPIIHIEAGLRSNNMTMPEEINRILTDHISTILITPSQIATENLLREGIAKEKIFLCGDLMSDAVLNAKKICGKTKSLDNYILLTLHRPYNTDDRYRLLRILNSLDSLGRKIIFPIHPRTNSIAIENNINLEQFSNINFIKPVSYHDLIKLQLGSYCIITDSGGIQKEAYILKKKCITLRSETEWVETLNGGWNTLVFEELNKIESIINSKPVNYIEHLYGDGKSAEKIVEILRSKIC